MAPSTTTTVTITPSIPSPLPTDLRHQLTSALLSASAIPTLQSTLYTKCEETGWLDAVRKRAVQLIREGEEVGEGVAYEEVFGRVMGEAKAKGRESGGGKGHGEGKVDVRVPEVVVNEGTKIVREALEKVVVIERKEEHGG